MGRAIEVRATTRTIVISYGLGVGNAAGQWLP
jgi:hypothetical protein